MTLKTILSTTMGQFYTRPEPGAAPFASPGDAISVGSPIGLVEIMKTFTPVDAEEPGKFVRYLVEDEDMVMPDDPLYEIEI
jgi:biotin carboxyl carrier protein